MRKLDQTIVFHRFTLQHEIIDKLAKKTFGSFIWILTKAHIVTIG
jgi:hypothetical protein